MVKWTFVQINHINNAAGWQVPDILRDGNIRYFEDALTALQFAEYKCAQFNKQHPELKKVPVINSQLYFQKKAEVEIGSKARERLGFDSSSITVPIRNIVVMSNPENTSMSRVRAFGQIIKNGETQSVMNRDPFSSSVVPPQMRWTNLSVLEVKRQYGYPVNTFFPVAERENSSEGFLVPPKKPLNEPLVYHSISNLAAQSMATPNVNSIPVTRRTFDGNAETFYYDVPAQQPPRQLYIGFDMAATESNLAEAYRARIIDDVENPVYQPSSYINEIARSVGISPSVLQQWNVVPNTPAPAEPNPPVQDRWDDFRAQIRASDHTRLMLNTWTPSEGTPPSVDPVPPRPVENWTPIPYPASPMGSPSYQPHPFPDNPNVIPSGQLGSWAGWFTQQFGRAPRYGYDFRDNPERLASGRSGGYVVIGDAARGE